MDFIWINSMRECGVQYYIKISQYLFNQEIHDILCLNYFYKVQVLGSYDEFLKIATNIILIPHQPTPVKLRKKDTRIIMCLCCINYQTFNPNDCKKSFILTLSHFGLDVTSQCITSKHSCVLTFCLFYMPLCISFDLKTALAFQLT